MTGRSASLVPKEFVYEHIAKHPYQGINQISLALQFPRKTITKLVEELESEKRIVVDRSTKKYRIYLFGQEKQIIYVDQFHTDPKFGVYLLNSWTLARTLDLTSISAELPNGEKIIIGRDSYESLKLEKDTAKDFFDGLATLVRAIVNYRKDALVRSFPFTMTLNYVPKSKEEAPELKKLF